MSVRLSRKRKKELRKLQGTANKVLRKQRQIANEAADLARSAGHQLGAVNNEVVVPAARKNYKKYVAPYVDKAQPYVENGYQRSRRFVDRRVIPAAGNVVGTALGAYDATAAKLGKKEIVPAKKKSNAGSVIAAVLGVAAAVGIFVAAWKTLSADDELWVADDPVASPDA